MRSRRKQAKTGGGRRRQAKDGRRCRRAVCQGRGSSKQRRKRTEMQRMASAAPYMYLWMLLALLGAPGSLIVAERLGVASDSEIRPVKQSGQALFKRRWLLTLSSLRAAHPSSATPVRPQLASPCLLSLSVVRFSGHGNQRTVFCSALACCAAWPHTRGRRECGESAAARRAAPRAWARDGLEVGSRLKPASRLRLLSTRRRHHLPTACALLGRRAPSPPPPSAPFTASIGQAFCTSRRSSSS